MKEWWHLYLTNCGPEAPSHFAEALSRTIPREASVLDLGCGSGIVGLYCLIEGKAQSVTFADLRREWIDITRENVTRKISEGLICESQVAVLEAASFTELPAEVLDRHDLVAFNPPQLPFKYLDERRRDEFDADAIRRDFRCGGPDGLEVVKEFLRWYVDPRQLKPVCILVLSSFLGRALIAETLASFGVTAQIAAETSVPLRAAFWAATERLSTSEQEDRSLLRSSRGWRKQLLTYRIKRP